MSKLKKKTIILIFAIIAVAFIFSLFYSFGKKKTVENFFHGSRNIFSQKDDTKENIARLITNATENQNGRFAVFIKDLNHQKTYELNSSEIFPSASLYKLAVMYKTFDALESGQIKKDDVVSEKQSVLDNTLSQVEDGDSDTARNVNEENSKEAIVGYQVDYALSKMITISDNYSAILLAQKLGWRETDLLMENEGFGEIDLVSGDGPTVSARSIGALLEKIYSNKAVSADASVQMKELLFGQRVNDRIPKYLPSFAKVGHKTGELDQIRHDAGIIYGKNSNYIFVFLSETTQPLDASETIAKLSADIFQVLEKD